MALLRNRCLILALLLVSGISLEFWTVSRYPALQGKAAAADSGVIQMPAFDPVFEVNDGEPLYLQTLKTAVNWGKTNLRGMSFGLMLGAALMCLISLLRKKSFSGPFANSAFGVFLGMPLGVCVNCAAPILRGLHASGLRLETVIAAMISSPTLNVIVLTMLFALFPPYLVMTKLAITLLLLLLVVPLLGKYVFTDEMSLSVQRALTRKSAKQLVAEPSLLTPTEDQQGRWRGALWWLCEAFIRNLWYVCRVAVPLMILAALLGATAMVLLPFEMLVEFAPDQSLGALVIGLLLTALVGTFLPVPITFDVLLVAALLVAGLPGAYAAALLCTLGTYSIYSHMMVSQAISSRVALALGAAVVLLGAVGGLAAAFYLRWATV